MDMERLSIAIPHDLKEQIFALRKQDKYCRLTISEIVRQMILKGLEAEAAEQAGT